mmetsp:Transcript_149191/g.260608  ORF Transcript_149191/g.260608 Transcript_149191/m.260608 type:complete len:86 (+) Transcript_149191:88-345(+)
MSLDSPISVLSVCVIFVFCLRASVCVRAHALACVCIQLLVHSLDLLMVHLLGSVSIPVFLNTAQIEVPQILLHAEAFPDLYGLWT